MKNALMKNARMKNALMKNALMSSDKTLVKVKYPYQITLCESFRCLRGRECLFLTITPCQLELLEPAVSFSCMELVPHKLKDFAHCIELLPPSRLRRLRFDFALSLDTVL